MEMGRDANLRLCLREIRVCSICPAWRAQEAEPTCSRRAWGSVWASREAMNKLHQQQVKYTQGGMREQVQEDARGIYINGGTSATSPYSKSPETSRACDQYQQFLNHPRLLLPWGVVFHLSSMRCSQREKMMSSISRIKEGFRPSPHAGFDTELYSRGETLLKSPKFHTQSGEESKASKKLMLDANPRSVWAARTPSHWKRCRHTHQKHQCTESSVWF